MGEGAMEDKDRIFPGLRGDLGGTGGGVEKWPPEDGFGENISIETGIGWGIAVDMEGVDRGTLDDYGESGILIFG